MLFKRYDMNFNIAMDKNTLWQRLADAFRRDYCKMGDIGYGKYVAVFTVALYFTLELEILKAVWPYVYGTIPDIPLYALSMIAVILFVTALYNFSMYFIYTRQIPFFEQFRANKKVPWPWESDPKQWSQMLWRSIKVNCMNIFIVGPIVTVTDSLIDFKFRMDLESVPDISTMLWQIGLFMVVGQFSFYWVHRIMHLPQFYWIHKGHHEYSVAMSLAPQYAHPLQHILANTVPVGMGYKLLSKVYPVHIFTILIWITMRMFETCDGHSGYNWPWGQSQLLPFSAGGSYHFFHHKQNVGNYGAILNIFDTVFNTNKDYYRYVDKEEEKSD